LRLRVLLALTLAVSLSIVSLPAAQDVWPPVKRVVAIGDVHGDYEQFFTLLQEAGLVNRKGRWIGGETHLVQTGDIPDRGPHTRKIMDLMMRLEKQARKAGGRVHALIGNHEAMNVYGDLRYVTPEEFAEFRTSDSGRIREAFWQQHVEQLKKEAAAEGKKFTISDQEKQQWFQKHPLGYFEHRLAWGPKGKYGKWVRSHNTVIKIGGTLFVHGGISPRFAGAKIREINETVRKELNDFSLLKDGITVAEDGPLWYRGLAQGKERELAGHVETVLANYGVKRIVIGHTPTAGTVMPRFGGKVLLIDVGLSKYYGRRRACLVIEGGKPYTLHRGKRLELPGPSRAALVEYLSAAAALDPPPSPLEPLIRRLRAASP